MSVVRRRTTAIVAALATVAVATTATVAASTGGASAAAAIPTPDNDPFYAAPANVASYANGAIIRSRSVNLTFSGIPLPIKSYQLLYKSTDAKNQPVADLTTLAVPTIPWFGKTARPIVSYQAAEDSVGTTCAPSYALRSNSNSAIIGDGIQFSQALLKGWAVAVPDYEGSKSEFSAGRQAGHAVLDGIRAVQSYSPAGVSKKNPVGLWGYSGGGGATAWASELQGTYAPDLTISGAAEGGVFADVGAVVKKIDGTAFAGFEFAGILGLSRAYPEMQIDSVVTPAGAAILAKLQTACETDILSAFANKKIDDYTLVPDTISQPVYQTVIADNKLGGNVPVAPVYNYHSTPDEIIPVEPANDLVAKYCSEGVKVTKVRFPIGEHITGAVAGAGGALDFLSDRFNGKAATTTC